jgi:SRSO17 transposase
MAVGALDETGQQKQGSATAGVKRQYTGCAGRVANGINTVHLSYVREKTGHALAGARQWIPAEDIADPVKSLVTGLPLDLRFRTKGQLAAGILAEAYDDGLSFDFVCGDEVYGRGSKGERWYAWAWLATASPRHTLPARRHLKTGELAFHYCLVPGGQPASKARLIRAARLRWPVEESFELAKGCFGLDQCQARLYTAILRHAVLVMAALAVCAVSAAQLKARAGTGAPLPAGPGSPPPAGPGLVPLTVREVRRLLAAALRRPKPAGHAARWLEWRRRHQAQSRWFHQRARLERNYTLVS